MVLRENAPEDVARGAKPLEVEGLAKAVAARVMSLAGDGRILLTRTAYDFARRAAVGATDEAQLRWAAHGRYRFAGVEDPVEVCEAAVPGPDPLAAPRGSDKAQRAVDDAAPVAAVAAATPNEPAPSEAAAEIVLAVLAFDNLSSDPEMQFFRRRQRRDHQRLARGARLR